MKHQTIIGKYTPWYNVFKDACGLACLLMNNVRKVTCAFDIEYDTWNDWLSIVKMKMMKIR
jgi:hypothetical protein